MTQGSGLSDAYTATLTRLKTQKGNKSALGLKVLMWVLYSERPLKTEELRHALGVELGSTDLDHENLPASRTLLASSLGLVTVEASSSTMRLVHFTLQEHLLSDSTLFHSTHSEIAEVCLTYLNFQSVQDLPSTLLSAPVTLPLLEYASYYWGEHTRKEMTENVKILALRLLNKFDEHVSAQLILLRYEKAFHWPHLDCHGGPIGFTGLHGIAFLGIAEIFPAVLEMKEWDVNAMDNASCTPLIWAAVIGHEDIVKMFLERGDVNPDLEAGIRRQTALLWAAEKGHERVVKVFLEREDVHPSPGSCLQALYSAAAWEREEVVKMLLEREDVNPNQIPTGHCCTPLEIAACNGYEGVVKIFLERVHVNLNQGEALRRAVSNGHEGVVKILLEREDTNPNIANTHNVHTPLSYAGKGGYERMVKMLLDRNDICIDIPDHENQTPLSWALSRGHDEIATMISDRAAIKSDTADPGNQESPPLWAGHEDGSMAEMELRDDHSNANIEDPSGQPAPPLVDPDAPEELSGWEGPVPDSVNSIFPSTGRLALLRPFPCGLRSSGIPEVKLPLIQMILRQLSRSPPTSI